jgi:MinD-like ATPase involved in chromosome partitioning or flagellar assembly
MLPSDIRLFTWIDVEAVIQAKFEEKECPDTIVWVRAYWDGLFIGIQPDKKDKTIDWLAEIFEPRFDKEKQAIILESLPKKKRFLNVLIEETNEKPPQQRFKPSLHRPPLLCNSVESASPPEMPPHLPPVVAFHSFKGGVGRTISALSMAKAITDQGEGTRVLFIDADLEAPGVTWLVQKRFPNPSVSFADFLALVHGDPNPDGSDSIDIVVERIREMVIDQIYILPAFRTAIQFATLEIRPEHLIQGAQNPFILSEAVAMLGSRLGVDVVIVDLRAGLSELSTGFLLDPRVFRVIVTTLSSQSIEGTCREMVLLGKLAPSLRKNEPAPALVFSQVPEDSMKNGIVAKHEERMFEAAKAFLESENGDDYIEMPRIITPFTSLLQVLPNDWSEVMKRILIAGLTDEFKQLIDWLPLTSSSLGKTELEAETVAQQRGLIAAFSKKLIYAETGTLNEFLSIPPLRNLASDYLTKIPVSVVVGAKGSGKTYTFLQVVFRSDWAEFIKDVGVGGSPTSALICPVMKSKNIVSDANNRMLDARTNVARQINCGPPPELSEISDYIKDRLNEELHEGKWREIWIDILAWSAGFEKFKTGAGRRLSGYLADRQTRLLPIIDGLEDLFQDLSSNDRQKTAIRALIQDVPEWLEQQPDRNVGLLVFIRQDMVLTAVKQNTAQLMARYEPHALRWNVEEALRLAAWICAQSNAMPDLKIKYDLQKINKDDLTSVLIGLWGRKLGSERSKEARSAEWVIAALSDLKGQIQARDLVRFLHEAARGSEPDMYWKDRILVPTAIKGALQVCSTEKINEISIENNELNEIFNKLRDLSQEYRQIPFVRDQTGLTIEQVQTLENNDVAYLEKEEYYIPEIYRAGLGFKLKAGARPRVLALSRKVRK